MCNLPCHNVSKTVFIIEADKFFNLTMFEQLKNQSNNFSQKTKFSDFNGTARALPGVF